MKTLQDVQECYDMYENAKNATKTLLLSCVQERDGIRNLWLAMMRSTRWKIFETAWFLQKSQKPAACLSGAVSASTLSSLLGSREVPWTPMSKTEAQRVMRDLAEGEKIRKHLGACIGNLTPPEAGQYLLLECRPVATS